MRVIQALNGVKREYIKIKLAEKVERIFGISNVYAMDRIITHESGYNPNAINSSSGACGLGQALPCSKMPCPLGFKGSLCQIDWVTEYIQRRYVTPNNAWEFWKENKWY